MFKIYSKCNPHKLLHAINRIADFKERIDLVDANNFLQLATLKFNKGKTFRPHMHLWKDINFKKIIAQESWVVINGAVKVFFYDLDKSLIQTEILYRGDCSLTFEGGHNYEFLEADTLVYEFKTGPYEGQIKDKIFIDD
jgi:hypothetical protein